MFDSEELGISPNEERRLLEGTSFDNLNLNVGVEETLARSGVEEPMDTDEETNQDEAQEAGLEAISSLKSQTIDKSDKSQTLMMKLVLGMKESLDSVMKQVKEMRETPVVPLPVPEPAPEPVSSDSEEEEKDQDDKEDPKNPWRSCQASCILQDKFFQGFNDDGST